MRYTWMLPCAVLGGVLMAACQVLIYRYAPVEQTMGLVQKIFYTHLPLAWWSFVSFFLVCVSGVAYLKTRNRHWDAVAGAAAEVGVVLSGLALVSGSIWARISSVVAMCPPRDVPGHEKTPMPEWQGVR